MSSLYKGYIETKDKKSTEKLKGRTSWKTLEEVRNCDGYAGMLADDTIMVDLDDRSQADILMNMVEDLQMFCKVICTTRGKHFLFKNTNGLVTKNYTHVTLAVGLTADIKLGSKCSYEVLKTDGQERFCEWDIEDGEEYGEVPKWLIPVGKVSTDFLSMDEGDGRNDALFRYILKLQSKGFTKEECRECIRLMNKYILQKPLGDDEVETILRDEAFPTDVFYKDKIFQHDVFGDHLMKKYSIRRIGNKPHIYKDGIYTDEYLEFEKVMKAELPKLKGNQIKEVYDHVRICCPDGDVMGAEKIAFKNGILDIDTGELMDFSPNMVVVNQIPWDYRPDAYDELGDKVLDDLSVHDEGIRHLMEECIGYCFYRTNFMKKAFIFKGDGDNGKSVFIKIMQNIFGDQNTASLDLRHLADRFNTARLFKKLVNLGDDIADNFISDPSVFKKIVSGDAIEAEFKNIDPFSFKPYAKLIFSVNTMPRIKDDTKAVLNRLLIVPFNAHFDKDSPDTDRFLSKKLSQRDPTEYFIKLGVDGLKRVLSTYRFSESQRVQQELQNYLDENNSIIGFYHSQEDGFYKVKSVDEVYSMYRIYCMDCGVEPESKKAFGQALKKEFGLESKVKRVGNKTVRFYG